MLRSKPIGDRQRPGIPQQLTFGVFDDQYPAWRSDGEKIAFVRNISGQVRIWTMNADGSDWVNITSGILNAGQNHPDWQHLTISIASAMYLGSILIRTPD